MTRRMVVAVAALALIVAGCSGGRVVRKAGTDASPHRARSVSRFELDDSTSLPGQPGGFALDRQGAVVEISEKKVVAFDTEGEQRWSTSVAGAALGWPWLGHGVAVVPTLSADDLVRDDGGCVALDRATGARRWSYEEHGRSGVAVAGLGDRVYCVFGDGTMVAVDVETGELVWHAVVDRRPQPVAAEVSERTALVIDGTTRTLAFTARWGAHEYLMLRDLTTGAERGELDLVDPHASAPVAIGPGELAYGVGSGHVCTVDLRRGVKPPCITGPSFAGFDPASIPVATNGLVIAAGRDGSVTAVDIARRKVRWTKKLDAVFLDAKPVVAGGVVIVADGTRTTWALRVSDGSKVVVPSVEGFVISTAADPGGGVAVAVRAELWGEIQRWRPPD